MTEKLSNLPPQSYFDEQDALALLVPRAKVLAALADACHQSGAVVLSAQPLAPVLDDRWKARMLDGRAPERDEMGFGNHPELPWLDEGMMPRSFFAALGLELAHTSAEDQLDGDVLGAMSEAVNWSRWMPTAPQGGGWKLVSIFDTEDGPVAWWLRELPEAEDGTTTIRNLQAEVEKLEARIARAGAAPAAVAPQGEYPSLPEAAVWSVAGKDGMPTLGKGWMFSPVQQGNATLPLFTARQMWAYHDLGRQAAPALEAPAAPAAPAPKFDLRTSDGGRGYVAWHFANVLKRHDFHNYIHNTLAADFARALARALETPEARGATDDAIDAIVLRQTGFDGDGYQAMTADELRRIVRSALGELAAAPQAPAATDELRKIAAIAACWGCDHPDAPGDTELVRRIKWAARQLRAVAQAPAAPSADERAAYAEFLAGKFPQTYSKEEAEHWWDHGHVSALTWKAARATLAAPAAPAVDARDTARMNWLEAQVVNVRAPLRYGSRDMFWASPEEVDGGPDGPSDLRARIDAAQAAAKGATHD